MALWQGSYSFLDLPQLRSPEFLGCAVGLFAEKRGGSMGRPLLAIMGAGVLTAMTVAGGVFLSVWLLL
jgi:hypothetical protein